MSETSWNVLELITYVHRSRRGRREEKARKGKERKIRQRKKQRKAGSMSQ